VASIDFRSSLRYGPRTRMNRYWYRSPA
jgi:hypothetical protein